MKVCFKCNAEKELTEFYKHSQMKDGRVNKCKDCNRLDVVNNTNKNIEYYKEYDKKRAMLPHRVKARCNYQKTPAGKNSMQKARKKYADNNPVKRNAVCMVSNAVRDGRLKKPSNCTICGEAKPRIHGHHYDYTKPLDVIWCCPSCHSKIHKGEIEAKVTFEQLKINLDIDKGY